MRRGRGSHPRGFERDPARIVACRADAAARLAAHVQPAGVRAAEGARRVSRTQRAMLASMFTYLQFGAAIIVGIVVVPLVLSRVDLRHYGLWLAAADLIGYIALLDLGVFGVLPWVVAEADGGRDEDTMR